MLDSSVKESYKKYTNRWNVGTMIAVGSLLYGSLAFFVSSEINAHRNNANSHPVIVAQLIEIRSDQLRMRILDMDERICTDPDNTFYKTELIGLITKWEAITKQKFPLQLLRCAK